MGSLNGQREPPLTPHCPVLRLQGCTPCKRSPSHEHPDQPPHVAGRRDRCSPGNSDRPLCTVARRYPRTRRRVRPQRRRGPAALPSSRTPVCRRPTRQRVRGTNPQLFRPAAPRGAERGWRQRGDRRNRLARSIGVRHRTGRLCDGARLAQGPEPDRGILLLRPRRFVRRPHRAAERPWRHRRRTVSRATDRTPGLAEPRGSSICPRPSEREGGSPMLRARQPTAEPKPRTPRHRRRSSPRSARDTVAGNTRLSSRSPSNVPARVRTKWSRSATSAASPWSPWVCCRRLATVCGTRIRSRAR